MNINKKLLAVVVAMAGAVGAGSASAALVQGPVGVTSEGNLDITLVIPPLISVTGLSNINLGTFDGVTDATGSSGACVRTNGATLYTVTATSANGSFVLDAPPASDTIAYAVSWAGQPLGYGGAGLPAQTPEATTLGSSGSCVGAAGKIVVDVLAADMQLVAPGTYTDTLVILVAPN